MVEYTYDEQKKNIFSLKKKGDALKIGSKSSGVAMAFCLEHAA